MPFWCLLPVDRTVPAGTLYALCQGPSGWQLCSNGPETPCCVRTAYPDTIVPGQWQLQITMPMWSNYRHFRGESFLPGQLLPLLGFSIVLAAFVLFEKDKANLTILLNRWHWRPISFHRYGRLTPAKR